MPTAKDQMIVIRPNGNLVLTLRDTPPTLQEMQTILGGYVELITNDLLYLGESAQVFCNEDGKRQMLDANMTATTLCAGFIWPDDVIVGTVVLLTGKARWH